MVKLFCEDLENYKHYKQKLEPKLDDMEKALIDLGFKRELIRIGVTYWHGRFVVFKYHNSRNFWHLRDEKVEFEDICTFTTIDELQKGAKDYLINKYSEDIKRYEIRADMKRDQINEMVLDSYKVFTK